jgi:multidrug efflux pump subunit AcrB
MEREGAEPVEAGLASLKNVAAVRSMSRESECEITIPFRPGEDAYAAGQEVLNVLTGLSARLPAGFEPPSLTRGDPDRLPALWVVLASDTRPLGELSVLAEREVRRRLLATPGVGSAELAGLRRRAIMVYADPDKLTAYGLDPEDLLQALRSQVTAAQNWAVEPGAAARVRISPAGPRDLDKTLVASRAGTPIFLRDVAAVEDTFLPARDLARRDGKRVVVAAVHPNTRTDPREVAAVVTKALADLRTRLPADVNLTPVGPLLDQPAREGPAAVWLDVRFPAGASIDDAERAAAAVEARLRELAPGASALTFLGPEPDTGRVAVGVYVPSPAAGRLRKELDGLLPGLSVRVLDLSHRGLPPSRRYPLAVALTGPDLAQLRRWADATRRRLTEASAVTDLSPPESEGAPRIEVVPDRERLALVGIPVRRLAEVVQLAQGGVPAGWVEEGETRHDVRLAFPGGKRGLTVEGLNTLRLRADGGRSVFLRDVAEARIVTQPTSILRIDGRRAVEITGNPPDGVTAERAAVRCREVADEARQALKLSGEYRAVSRE